MKKIVFLFLIISVFQGLHAQYCDKFYVAKPVSIYTISETDETVEDDLELVEDIPLFSLFLSSPIYFTFTQDYNYIQMLESDGGELGDRIPYTTKIHEITPSRLNFSFFKQHIEKTRPNNNNVFSVLDDFGKIAYISNFTLTKSNKVTIYKLIETKPLQPLLDELTRKKELEEQQAKEQAAYRKLKAEENLRKRHEAFIKQYDTGSFGSKVTVIKSPEMFDQLVRNLQRPMVLMYTFKCMPSMIALETFFEIAAINFSNEADFYLINDDYAPISITVKDGKGNTLGRREYGISGYDPDAWDVFKQKYSIKSIPSFIVIYNKKGDMLKLSGGYSRSVYEKKMSELTDALRQAKSYIKDNGSIVVK